MIIQRLDLKAFGLFTDSTIDLSAGPKRFHLVYGPNESGKSTSLRAITSLLFGMTHLTDDNFLHANAQMRVGALLADESGKTLEIVRRRGRKGTLRDGQDGQTIEESVLEEMLGGVDRETFLSRFGISHDELTAGGQSILQGDGDLGEILFAAGAGVGRLRDIQNDLDEDSRKLFTPRGSRTINAELKQLDEKRKELRQAQLPPSEFIAVGDKTDQKRARVVELNQSMQQVALELARLKAYRQAMPLVPQWKSDFRALAELADTPLLDEAFSDRRRQFETEQRLTETQHAELSDRMRDLDARVATLPEDAAIMGQASEVQTLFQELAARDKADRDRVDLVRVQRNADRKITDLLRELSVELLTDDESDKADLIDDSVQRLRVSDSLRTRVHELAAQHERLNQQRDDARDHVEAIRKRLAEVHHELELLATPVDPTSLAGVIDSIGAPAAILDSLARQQEDCDHLRRDCESRTRRLEGFHGSYQEASQLQLPMQRDIDQAAEAIRDAAERVAVTRERVTELKRDLDRGRSDLERQQSGEPLPTMEQLRLARAERDQAIDRVANLGGDAGKRDDEIATLRDRVRSADQLVDTIRMHHKEVHQRALQLEKVETLATEIAEREASVGQWAEKLHEAQTHWTAIWESCGVAADTPERMKRWLADHQQLVLSVQRLDEERERLDQVQRSVQRSTNRLRAAVGSVAASKVVSVDTAYTQVGLFDDEPVQDLVALYDEAVSLRSELSRFREQHDALTRRRDELAEELPLAETRLETHGANVDKWQSDWRRVTESFAESDHATPTVVMSMLRRIDELCEKKRERDILASRIRSIGDDELAFGSRVKRVADAVGFEDPQQNDPGAITQILYQRLQSERTASRQRDVLNEQIEETRRRLADLGQKRAGGDVALRQLCGEAGCDSPEQLPAIERRSRERLRVESSLRDHENQLALLADDDPVESFVAAVAEQKPALLDIEIERKEDELDLVRREISTANQEIGALQHELRSMDGGGHAAEVLQSIQLMAGRIGRDAEEYARLRVASLLLRRAIDHYRRENQSPVLERAEQIFGALTCGEYQALKVDFDAKGKSILFGVRAGDGTVDVPAPAMSTGTADALYLAMRLASLQHQLHHGKPIPLIIDDCLIQLDDKRCIAALKSFSDLSTSTQVILFTHHQHLIDLARTHLGADDFHEHCL